MSKARRPHRLMLAGTLLLSSGYIALASSPKLAAGGRLAFYAGVAMLIVGFVLWVQQPPAPEPTLEDEPESE